MKIHLGDIVYKINIYYLSLNCIVPFITFNTLRKYIKENIGLYIETMYTYV